MTLRVTINQVMDWEPCEEYTRERVAKLYGRRKYLNALQILDLDIPAEDRIWAVCHEELVDPTTLRLFACREAELALNRVKRRGGKVDPRSREAIRVARRYARGQATDEELAAAEAAATAAAAGATWAAWAAWAAEAAWAAAEASWAAAWAAAWAAESAAMAAGAAEAAAWAAQVRRLRRMLEVSDG